MLTTHGSPSDSQSIMCNSPGGASLGLQLNKQEEEELIQGMEQWEREIEMQIAATLLACSEPFTL